MRKLGLIGGCGPESTASYYLGVVNGVRERAGRSSLPGITIESLGGPDVLSMAEGGRREELVGRLLAGIESLADEGCDLAAIGCCAAHLVFREVQERSPLPLVSIVDATRDEVVSRGHRCVLVLGASVTMRERFLTSPIALAHVAVLTPGGADKEWLGGVISDELGRGIVRDGTVEAFARLVGHAHEHGAQAVVLACPELSLLAGRVELPIPVIDALEAHVGALVDAAMG